MKKSIITSLLLGLPMMMALSGCDDKDEIIFDHELPQFETRADAILLEVIMPSTTAVDDKIYIVGDFNGGEEVAVGNPLWQLEKAQGNDVKWGIYVDPANFVEGTSLADGYYFFNKEQGAERSLFNEDIVRVDNPAKGTRTNLTVDRWAAYFERPVNPDEIEHDGVAIFIVDQSGYDDIALYAWGDAEIFGGWPGALPTGRVTIDNVTYKYFDTGEANRGLNVNLIFNNNGGGQQYPDYNITLDEDVRLLVAPEGVSVYDPNAFIEHDGYTVYVYNNTGWADADVSLYMWGDVNDLNGGWPGMKPTGSQTFNGVKYLYFDMGEANEGLAENLIFSNNGDNQLNDFAFTIDRDIFVEITLANGVKEIDPETFTPGDAPEPPVVLVYHKLYVEDLTGWDTLGVYSWGDTESFGGWPGALSTDCDTVEISGHKFIVFEGVESASANLIFHDNNGTQYDGPAIAFDRDYYFTVTATTATEINPDDLTSTYRIYVQDLTGWTNLYVYAWGDDNSFFGGWPGTQFTATATVAGVEYKYIEFTSMGEKENLIFNNNDGTQLADFYAVLDRDYYLIVTPNSVTEVKN